MTENRIDTLRRMAAEVPEDPRVHFGLAVELLREGQTMEGVQALRAYLALAQDEGNGWGRLGAALAELGEVEEARDAYARGIAVARKRGHDGLTEELEEALEDLPITFQGDYVYIVEYDEDDIPTIVKYRMTL